MDGWSSTRGSSNSRRDNLTFGHSTRTYVELVGGETNLYLIRDWRAPRQLSYLFQSGRSLQSMMMMRANRFDL